MKADICNMYILVVAATAFELAPVIEWIETRDNDSDNYLDIEALVTGVGAVPTSYLLGYNVNNHRPDLIIQAGIAGSFQEEWMGKIVAVKADYLGGQGVWEQGQYKDLFDMQLADPNQFPYTNRMLVNPFELLLADSGLPQVNAITVGEPSTSKPMIDWYEQTINPVVESMEGAALHYVGLQEHIPFLQIRAISNMVGERDKSKWLIKESIELLNTTLLDLIKQFAKQDDNYYRI